MKARSLEPEILDVRRPPRDELTRAYRFLEWINRRLGGVRAMVRALEAFAPRWTGPVRLLDVGTGIADIPRAVVDWARATGRRVEVVALDREGDTLELAREASRGHPEIAFVRGDVRELPFAARSFDYVLSSLFLHHLPDDGAVGALRAFDRLARRGIVVNDLLRRRRLLWWTRFFTLFGGDIVRTDGPLSVRKAFTLTEIEAVVARAGLGWLTARVVFGHRFVLAGEKR
jgi:SAM-dependent methyltransferase